VDILKADAVEAEMLTGERDIHKAAADAGGWGPKEIVLTPATGCWYSRRQSITRRRSARENWVGRSGRGDTCVASYVASGCQQPPKEACLWSRHLPASRWSRSPIKKSWRMWRP